jgi:hypothetical protein
MFGESAMPRGDTGMALEDKHTTRVVEREISRRQVDATLLSIRVSNGVCYVRGQLRHQRAHPEVDLDREVATIQKILRNRDGVRAVIWEAETRH